MNKAPALVKPGPELEEAFREMNEEFLGEPYYREYSDFSQLLQRFAIEEVKPDDPARVPMSIFWLQSENGRLIGEVRLRHQLNVALEHEGGNIGYNIRPSDRGKGYGTLILGLMLDHARSLGQSIVQITCDSDNFPSSRIILKHGGILQSQGVSRWSGKDISRYRINLR